MKREDKAFLCCFIIVLILAILRAQTYCDYMEQQEETNRIVKELQERSTEVDHTDIR
ncbi:hypothetical protein [Agathobacter sp.]|uniref:hypothetical protein n=1 Tax=Agathobacter sp. TaxID=2021311 RepID=UPI003AB7BFC6